MQVQREAELRRLLAPAVHCEAASAGCQQLRAALHTEPKDQAQQKKPEAWHLLLEILAQLLLALGGGVLDLQR